jgi:hypothetical protein
MKAQYYLSEFMYAMMEATVNVLQGNSERIGGRRMTDLNRALPQVLALIDSAMRTNYNDGMERKEYLLTMGTRKSYLRPFVADTDVKNFIYNKDDNDDDEEEQQQQ